MAKSEKVKNGKPRGAEKWQELFRAWLKTNEKKNQAFDRDFTRGTYAVMPTTSGAAARFLDLSTAATHKWFHGLSCPHWHAIDHLASAMGLPEKRIRRAINATRGPNPVFASQAKAAKVSHEKRAAMKLQSRDFQQVPL